MDKTWIKHYPADVPAEIDVSAYRSLVELLEESFKKHRNAALLPDRSASREPG